MNNLLRFYFFNYEILKWKANSRNRYGDYLGEIKYPSLGYKISKIMGIKKVGSRLEIYISRLLCSKLIWLNSPRVSALLYHASSNIKRGKGTLKSNKLRQSTWLPEVTKCGTFLTPALQTKLPIMCLYLKIKYSEIEMRCENDFQVVLPNIILYIQVGKIE